jgi:hypothetical protein
VVDFSLLMLRSHLFPALPPYRLPPAEEPMLRRRVEELEGMAHAAAGQEFCLGSPQEVRLGWLELMCWLCLQRARQSMWREWQLLPVSKLGSAFPVTCPSWRMAPESVCTPAPAGEPHPV